MVLGKYYTSEDPEREEQVWKKFSLFKPDMRYVNRKQIRTAIEEGQRDYFLRIFQANFFPGMEDCDIESEIKEAMLIGNKAANFLLQEHCPEHYGILQARTPTHETLFDLIASARERKIAATQGKHVDDRDYTQLARVYNDLRAVGFAYRILRIKTSPQIIDSIDNYEGIKRWFADILGFADDRDEDVAGLTRSWQTNAGVRIYARDSPLRSRLKIKRQNGELKYSSILMKMFLREGRYLNQLNDYSGVEFITETQEDVVKLENFFRSSRVLQDRLEKYKGRRRGSAQKGNLDSAEDFSCTKFLLRIPVRRDEPTRALQIGQVRRVPVETQLFTLDAHVARSESGRASHEEYKRRQRAKVFPLWFPSSIYEPLFCSEDLEGLCV
jgi:hypothetical protein